MHDGVKSRRVLAGARRRSRQFGVIAPLAAVAMLALLAMVGLALDGSFLLINKTRLQNTVDAAALYAAKILDDSGDTALAEQGVSDSIGLSVDMGGNGLLSRTVDDWTVTTEFSNTLVPFDPGTSPARFVRVTVQGFTLPTFLVRVLGRNNFDVSASAVSGPSPPLNANVCDIAPFVLCQGTAAVFSSADLDGDGVLEDYNAAGNRLYHGYPEGELLVLKYGGGQAGLVGNGNYHLINLPGLQGGDDIRDAAAGLPDMACTSVGDTLQTKSGNTAGPVLQGLASRFYDDSKITEFGGLSADFETRGPGHVLSYDAKLVGSNGIAVQVDPGCKKKCAVVPYTGLNQLDFTYADYQQSYAGSYDAICSSANVNPEKFRCHRRILTVPVGICTGGANGNTPIDAVVGGFMCVYLVQPLKTVGNDANVFIQIVKACDSDGSFTQTPINDDTAPTKMVLYKDPARVDS